MSIESSAEQSASRPDNRGNPLSPTIRLHPADDVVIARHQLISGARIAEEDVTVSGLIPAGHKVAVRRIDAGKPVRRYNQIIGVTTRPIEPGQHIHTHNLAMAEFARDYAYAVDAHPTVPAETPATFEGIVRADGRVATRNYIGILTSVNCSATVAHAIADHFRRDIHPEALADHPNVDGVVALTHGGGCGIDTMGPAMQLLRRTLAGYAVHPNFHSVLMIGLGCEANQISGVLAAHNLDEGERIRVFTIQDTGGTTKTIARGIELIREMLPEANRVKRSTVPASHLLVGLQCGGSDGYSGITANPALGAAMDLLVAHGGTAILSETPEIYGAEHLLTRRAVSQKVGEKLIERIHWWEDYTARNLGEMNNNPSPGNKAGGLTTILEKSLGAAAKGGTTNLVDVYKYAEPITAKGFVFMDSPGYDPASVTGQVASGCNIVAFTTGRGSVSGFKPAPSIKLATNTPMYQRMADDMDINCGTIADGEETIEQAGERIFQLILDVASGKQTKSEEQGFGDSEFVPWQIGAVM